MLAVSGTGTTARAQSDDFNDGNDAGWQKLDLTVVGRPATFSFPDDGTGGKAYRILTPAPPVPDGGPARAFSYQAPDYTRFSVAVDIINWDLAVDHAFGILTRATGIGLGSTDGYVMNYNSADGDLQINEIAGESPTTIAEVAVPLDPTRNRYRWVFTGYNDNLVGYVFALPDTNNPVAAVVANESQHTSGKAGIFVFNRESAALYTDPASYADATFDNYSASAPAAGSLRAAIVELGPRPREEVRSIPPTVKVAILNRETDVNASSIALTVDGAVIPNANLTITPEVVMPNNAVPFPGLTVSYPITNLANLAGTHTNRITFQDNTGFGQTNEWTFTYATLHGTNAAPPGSGLNPGFGVRLVQASVVTANTLARAEQQLGTNPPPDYAAFTTNGVVSVINYTQKDTNGLGYVEDGYFAGEFNFPGIDPTVQTDPNDMAMEILAYLELPAGVHALGVRSDDGFKLSSGAGFADPNALVLGQMTSGTFDGTFDFVAEQAGLYPFRMLWYERGGGAHVELFSVNRTTAEKTLVNDPGTPSAIKAFRGVSAPAIVLESAAALVTGGFATENGATVDTVAKTVTVARSGNQRFYRLRGPTALSIRTTQISGGNVVLTYE
ncbi:MAG TPA: hypothetical protein VJW76_04610 [Verrucomicrobiae bacterium]|nr:hypothetical protein [Verrucomicrobiae bacterium]